MKPAEVFLLIRDAALAFGQDKAPRLAAAIAYYAMFSIAPILLFAVAIAGRFLTSSTVLEQLLGPQSIIAQNLGPEAAAFLQTLIPDPANLRKGSAVATTTAFAALFMGATGLFVQLQDALNSLWGADTPPAQGVLNVIKARLISFVMILAIGVLLLAFLVLNTYLAVISQSLGDAIGLGAVAVRLGTFALSIAFLTFVFAGIYKVLPDVKLLWREVIFGGAVTATLFSLGQLAIGLYFGRAAPGSVFGAAASLVLLMLWIYYSAMIFFFGAEVTWAYSQRYGTHAGGAANLAKKEALVAAGADISTLPDDQGQSEGNRATPVDKRRLKLPRLLPAAPRRDEGRLLPTVWATLWHAFTGLLAVPAVIVLRVLGITGGKRR